MADNNKISLFILVQHLLHEKLDRDDKRKITGYVYKMENDKDNLIYIGSTCKPLEKRFNEHINSFETFKFYAHMKKINANWKIIPIVSKNVVSYLELIIMEDYYIYKYQTIENGLNTRYNSVLTNIILNGTDKKEQISELINYIDNYCIKCNKYTNFISNEAEYIILTTLKDIKISNDAQYWFKKDGIEFYNPLIINKSQIHINKDNINYDTEVGYIDDNTVGLYLIYWNEKKYMTFYRKGGLKNILIHYNICVEHNIIREIVNNGIKCTIIPLSYFKTNNMYRIEVAIFVKKLTSHISKKNVDMILENRYNMLSDIYNLLELLDFAYVLPINILYEEILNIFQNNINKTNKNASNINNSYNDICDQYKILCAHKKNKCSNETNDAVEITENVNNEIPNNEGFNASIEQADNSNSGEKLEFYDRPGRPCKYKTDEEKHQAKLVSRRRWNETRKERVAAYNEQYYKKNRDAQLKRVHDNHINKKDTR
jgi:hypothetical protein